MTREDDPDRTWFWYIPRAGHSLPLAPDAYPLVRIGRGLVEGPTWACLEQNGGPFVTTHVDRRVGRIDVDVAHGPAGGIEMTYTTRYRVTLLARSWLREVEDLIDPARIFLGEVRVDGRPLENWVSVHEQWAPVLFGSEGRGKWCSRCGHLHMGLWGRIYFAEPEIAGRPLMVNTDGLFVREDIVLERKLRRPAGSYRPGRIRLQPTPRPGGTEAG